MLSRNEKQTLARLVLCVLRAASRTDRVGHRQRPGHYCFTSCLRRSRDINRWFAFSLTRVARLQMCGVRNADDGVLFE
jgi:hypothetical protein